MNTNNYEFNEAEAIAVFNASIDKSKRELRIFYERLEILHDLQKTFPPDKVL